MCITREGIVLHVWCQILRLSPHLFWLWVFKHGAFSSAQDDDTGAGGLYRHGSGMRVCVFLSNEIGDGMEVSPSMPCM